METTTSQSSIENSGTRGSDVAEQPIYKTIKDGYGNEIRVLNFDNPNVCRRTGIIELIPKRTSSRHQNRVSFRAVRDYRNNVVIGIPERIDPKTKEWVFQKITLVDSETLDLSLEQDAKKWAVIKNSHFLEGSPNAKGRPAYYVRDKELDAQKYLAKRKVKRDATTIAEGLIGEQLIDMARNLGIGVEQNSVTTLQMAVIQKAEDKPEVFMEIWDSPTRKELTLLKKALSLGIIVHEPLTGITYNSIPLGPNEPMAVMFLKENVTIYAAIDLLCQKKEDESVKAMKASASPVITNSDDAKMASLMAELAEAKKLNEMLSKKALEKELGEIGKDEEYEDLLKEAKALGIKGAHLLKTKEALQKKIEEAKN
jgi:hypothetical protein